MLFFHWILVLVGFYEEKILIFRVFRFIPVIIIGLLQAYSIFTGATESNVIDVKHTCMYQTANTQPVCRAA